MTSVRSTSLRRDEIADRLAGAGYVADRDLATALWLMDYLKRPLLLEGEAGVGKTEVAKALAVVHDPELGTIVARSIPRVVLTSNATRELSDALRRRCLYHYLDFPEVDREARIITTRLSGIDTALALQVARMVAAIRMEDLRKVPGVAETLDWAATLAGLEVHDLRQEREVVHETLICLLKTHEDRSRLTREGPIASSARWRE